jgi:hypothetical protein
MEKIIIILSFISILFINPAYGEEKNPDNVYVVVPPDMETIKEGNVNLVVYKRDPLRKQGDVLMPESLEEYTSNKFADTDNRFKKVEKELEAQKKEIEDLKGAVKKLEKDGRKK